MYRAHWSWFKRMRWGCTCRLLSPAPRLSVAQVLPRLGTFRAVTERTASPYAGAMNSSHRPPDLDLVVLGGGGHVGLPLSLAFAKAGLKVGIFDISQPTLDRIERGEMPFLENGADQLLREILPTGRLTTSTDAAILARTDQVIVVIGTPVDE